MLFRLNPFAKNGIDVANETRVVVQGSSSTTSAGPFPDITFGTSTPVDGIDTATHFYYDTDDAILYVYVDGVWYPIGSSTPPITSGADIFGLLLTRNLQ